MKVLNRGSMGGINSFSNSHEQWDSWYRPPSIEKQNQPIPDYDLTAIVGMSKYRFGIDLPKSGAIVINFENNQIMSVDLIN